MEFNQDDIGRLMVAEEARHTAEETYASNPLDADNLTKWGGALLELAQYLDVEDCKKTINDAISKLEEALQIDPNKADTLCVLGNAYTSVGLMTPDVNDAKPHFSKATEYFERAANQEPSNEIYNKSILMAAEAPKLHAEIHKQGVDQQTGHKSSVSSNGKSSNAKSKKTEKGSDFKYDLFGWIILAVGIVAWVGMAKSHTPQPPSG